MYEKKKTRHSATVRYYKGSKHVIVSDLRVSSCTLEWSIVLLHAVLTILIHFGYIDIFKAVREGHINRSKIGNALISEIVTVSILAYFSSFRCSTFF